MVWRGGGIIGPSGTPLLSPDTELLDVQLARYALLYLGDGSVDVDGTQRCRSF